MTLNQASRKLDSDLLLAVNGSGLPLRVVELQVINLLNAIQLRLRQEEEKEEADAVIFAPGWRMPAVAGWNTLRRKNITSKSSTGRGDKCGDCPRNPA